jgi:hypothetical protein
VIPRRLTLRIFGAIVILVTAAASGGFDRADTLAPPRKADEPTGAWKLRCVSPDGKARECVIAVAREESGWSALYTADGASRPAKRVAVEEGFLVIEVDGTFAGQKYGMTYRGIPNGDTLAGSARWSYGWASGSIPFEGARIDEEIAATP